LFFFCLSVAAELRFLDLSPHIISVIFLCVVLAIAISPRGFDLKSRMAFYHTIAHIVITPFGREGAFCDFFVADVLVSMVRTLFDLEHSLCFILSGDCLLNPAEYHTSAKCPPINSNMAILLSFLPLMWRCLQCIRQWKGTRIPRVLFNALKYFISITVHLIFTVGQHHKWLGGFSMLWYVWFGSIIISTLYSYWWDIYTDWNLGDRKHGFLRSELTFKHRKWIYYYIIVSNLFFRFGWGLRLLPFVAPMVGKPHIYEVFLCFLGLIEVLRRFSWALLRVENEHLKQVKKK